MEVSGLDPRGKDDRNDRTLTPRRCRCYTSISVWFSVGGGDVQRDQKRRGPSRVVEYEVNNIAILRFTYSPFDPSVRNLVGYEIDPLDE